MIVLRPFFNPVFLDRFPAEELEILSNTSIESIEAFVDELWDLVGQRNFKAEINVLSAKDRINRAIYEEIQVQITGRYVFEGERFVIAGGFAISLDSHIEANLDLLSAVAQLKISHPERFVK